MGVNPHPKKSLLNGFVITVFALMVEVIGCNLYVNVLGNEEHYTKTVWGVLKLGVFFYLCLMTLVTYWLTISTPPGQVPAGWKPLGYTESELEENRMRSFALNGKRKEGPQALRWCTFCQSFKPPRTHHCSDCHQCCLKMDHHCPWTNNCVGYYNHKYF